MSGEIDKSMLAKTTVGSIEQFLGYKLPPASDIPRLLKKNLCKFNQYMPRDVIELDKKGNYFSKHMEAMTEENLVEKDKIAAELAWRDCEIDRLWLLYKRDCPSNVGGGIAL